MYTMINKERLATIRKHRCLNFKELKIMINLNISIQEKVYISFKMENNSNINYTPTNLFTN